MSFEAKAQSARLALVADEALANMRTVRAFAMEVLETELFAEQAEKSRMLNEKLGVGIAAFQVTHSRIYFNLILCSSQQQLLIAAQAILQYL